MSKNQEENFSLKDWVTRRAANMPEMVSEPVLRVQNGENFAAGEFTTENRTAIRAETIRMTEEADMAIAFEKEQDEENAAPKMTARISSATASMATSPSQSIQIVRLLRDLGDRLRQSEKEREILWRELDSCRKLLTDIEDKTSKTEQAFLNIETRINSRPVQEAEESREFQKSISEKISALETTTGSAVLRLEDIVAENAKLSRRLEESAQDKKSLMNKIEAMEEVVTQTQDALRAKALVLLTDQALAARTSLPQTSAWSGNDTLKTQEPAADPVLKEMFRQDALPWWKTKTRIGVNRFALVSLVVMGLAAGWGLSRTEMVPFGVKAKPVTQSAEQNASQSIDLGAALKPDEKESAPVPENAATDDQEMNAAAVALNDIEPGNDAQQITAAPEMEEPAAPKVEVKTAQQLEQDALNAFNAEKPSGSIASRITKDAELPANIKSIETKAFSGDANAQHDLAAIYTAGHAGVKTDYKRAYQWFNEAAHNNVANAQYNLGVLYHQGLGVKQDTARAIMMYEVAAANNHPEAQYNLGIAHIEGIGAAYSPQNAAHYFEAAVKNNVVEAAYNLGLIQENGLLGEAQPEEAIFWYKLAADRGDKQAKDALAQLTKQLNLGAKEISSIYTKMSAEHAGLISAWPKKAAATAKTSAAAPKAVEQKTTVADTTTAPVNNAKPVPVNAPAYDPVIVAQIQEQLIRMGLFSGSADGTADAKTMDAVKSYQAMNKLNQDGKPNDDLLAHMLASDMQAQMTPAAGQ